MIGVTGATGMIGGRVVDSLLSAYPMARLRCLVRHPGLVPRSERIEILVGDLISEPDCAEFANGLDIVLHLAQSNNPAASDRHWPSDCSANMITSLNLLDALRATGRRVHVVFASSGGAVYGQREGIAYYDESMPCAPLSAYGIQKLALENYLSLGVAQGWMSGCALRISNAFGAALPPERRQGLIGVAASRHRLEQPVEIFGSDETVRDYVHVDDIAAAFLAAMHRDVGFEAVNISSGVGHSVREILAMLGEVSGREVDVKRIDFGSRQFALTPRMVLCNAKAERIFGWVPRIPLSEGLTRLWND